MVSATAGPEAGARAPRAEDAPWSRAAGDVLRELGSSPDRGLDDAEAAARLLTCGSNALREHRGRSVPALLLDQLRDTMVVVLLVAAAMTVAVGDLQDTLVILLVIALNCALGVSQQFRAERAVTALARLSAPAAQVVRSGRVQRVPSRDVVPGDVLRLEAGDIVPADARLLTCSRLEADEAPLTGESTPARKATSSCADPGTPLGDRRCMVHAGTTVTAGVGSAVVTATGMRTEVGQVAQLLDEQRAPLTPLQRRLAVLGRQLAGVAVAASGAVVAVGLVRGEPLGRMLLTAVSLAVAAVPESLPAVVALSLALSARRMAERSAIVRSLPAVEALGAVTVIASDKTGTLTEGTMVVRRLWTPAAETALDGSGYDPAPVGPAPAAHTALLQALVLCNDARLVEPGNDGDDWSVVGDPTEGALLAAAGRSGVDRRQVRRQWPRVAEQPFDAARSRMTTVHEHPDGFLVVLKGAPEVVLTTPGLLAPGQDDALVAAAEAVARLSGDGFRVLAVASATRPDAPEPVEQAERGLGLLGLVALHDPPRAAAAEAVRRCREAGIVPLMITGDHPGTAASVAAQVGILRPGERVVTGGEVAQALSRGEVGQVRVYARTAPVQKLDIVQAWQAAGHVVAMTGDGVNDAPALRRADVGVAMGRSGTEVARQAADVVLADDRFGTVVAAVEEGRRDYDNIRRFLLYALTGGLAELLVMLLGPAVGLALPLLPAQILWVNLLTHGLPGVALGAEQAEPSVMRRPPRDPDEQVLGGGLWQRVLVLGPLVAAVGLVAALLSRGGDRPWQTVLFVALAAQQLLLALVVRSSTTAAWHVRGNPLLYAAVGVNVALLLAGVYWPPLAALLRTEPLSASDLALALVAALPPAVVVELGKARGRSRDPARSG